MKEAASIWCTVSYYSTFYNNSVKATLSMKKIVLLIDNNENEPEFFIEALHELDFPCDCICARKAEVALSLLRYTVPDFIFLDFNIPQMDGLKCLKEIKKLKIQESVPVILYSNEMSEEVTKNAMALGAMFCIKKPGKVSTFATILQRIFFTCIDFKVFLAPSKN
jgi:DNA-binding NtrC family response regulator